MNPDRLAELEEERRFLLRSMTDLEREHAAGDVDEVDYRELKDGYTVRAAATLREIDDGRRALPAKPAAGLATPVADVRRRRGRDRHRVVGVDRLVGRTQARPGADRARPS